MKITFYQVQKLFVGNSAYLGALVEQNSTDANLNMDSISKVSVLLNQEFVQYNYIRIDKDVNDYYYYSLEGYKYYIGSQQGKLTFNYKIDIIRTLRDRGILNHEMLLGRYSNELSMSEEQKNYFWRNQGTKLSANVRERYDDAFIEYSSNVDIQEAWQDMKWAYIWLHPRAVQKETVGGGELGFQYKFIKKTREYVINVLSTSLPIGQQAPKPPWHGILSSSDPKFFYNYPVGQLYYTTDTNRYYRFVEFKKVTGKNDFGILIYGTFRGFRLEADYEYDELTYYFNDLPPVQMTNVPNTLYCVVLPLKTIRMHRITSVNSTILKDWSVDAVLPYLFDVESENSWVNYIVDIKVSMIPPFDVNDPDLYLSTVPGTTNPRILIPPTVGGINFDPIKSLYERTVAWYLNVDPDVQVTPDVFIPFLRYKPKDLYRVKSTFTLPTVNKENIVYKKYYLSIVEQRKELDVPLLRSDNALTLYYYEDINPGRINIVVGFAPDYEDEREIVYYLMRSPSSIFLSRDTSLPTFTPAYQSYVASNKNFIQQAELSRDAQLAQSLIQSGASVVGAVGVGATLPGYSPIAAVANAGANIGNAFITHNVQKKNFNWAVDNMKAAPGNYKGASATVTFMLTLNVFNLWFETYRSNQWDINIYENLIDDVGFEYFEFTFTLNQIMDNIYNGTTNKKFLQGSLTGITYHSNNNMLLINILNDNLKEGVNVFL